ncbi:MAG: class I SAM-dependent methyltransferase [Bacteroidales bacterium]|nr:class I SAM-dependent methyltransferase [Bacteroidales bacterium]
MKQYFNVLFYRIFIDPLLSVLRKSITESINDAAKIIDIACGPGTLAVSLSRKAGHVTGIDIDQGLISFATSRARKKGLSNLTFKVHDASDLSVYKNQEFDIAVTSMAIHQFSEELAVIILREMKRIAHKIIIADYNYQMPEGFARNVAYGIESITKGDHQSNFRNYMSKGGIIWFTGAAGLTVKSTTIKGKEIFIVVECD